MPVTYLDVPPGLAVEAKRKLVKEIYDALHEAYPFSDDVRIFLREWPGDSISQNGRLGAEPARPVFHMHVPVGGDIDATRKMLKGVDSAVAEAYHLPDFMIFLQEYPPDRVAVNGGLRSDNAVRVEAQKNVYGR